MEIAMHASDVSNGCRDWTVCHEWVYMLFNEFFR